MKTWSSRFILCWMLLNIVSCVSTGARDRYSSDNSYYNHYYDNDRDRGRKRPETTEEVKTRLQGEYMQEVINQKIEQQRAIVEYETQKNKMQSEYQQLTNTPR